MVAPTDGYAFVDGKDIRNDMFKIRQETGICLQHVSIILCSLSEKRMIRFD
jgi:ABC-type multidrug transport system ATPase subunit